MSHYDAMANGNKKSEDAEVQIAGYKGLCRGLKEDNIRTLDWLEPGEAFSGLEISAADIFIAVQTDAALKRDKVQGKEKADKIRLEVERKVREFIINEARGSSSEQLHTEEKYRTRGTSIL
jgi:hypothetical protein